MEMISKRAFSSPGREGRLNGPGINLDSGDVVPVAPTDPHHTGERGRGETSTSSNPVGQSWSTAAPLRWLPNTAAAKGVVGRWAHCIHNYSGGGSEGDGVGGSGA